MSPGQPGRGEDFDRSVASGFHKVSMAANLVDMTVYMAREMGSFWFPSAKNPDAIVSLCKPSNCGISDD